MKNFRTYQLALDFHKNCSAVKLCHSAYQDQFRRAVLSICLNLAEGSAKPTSQDRRKFYRIALGSLREVQCLLHVSSNKVLLEQADILAAHLYQLCKNT